MSMLAVHRFRFAIEALGGNPHLYPDDALQKALGSAFGTMYGVRRPVGIQTTPDGDLNVVCDDGTVWQRKQDAGLLYRWMQLASIPGTIDTGGGVVSPLHTKLGQLRETLNMPGATLEWRLDEIKRILDS